jgi:hypothetical protein
MGLPPFETRVEVLEQRTLVASAVLVKVRNLPQVQSSGVCRRSRFNLDPTPEGIFSRVQSLV